MRIAKGLSQGDVAKALEIKAQSVSTWETMKTVPSADKLVELARLLECSLDYLCGIEGILDGGETKPTPPQRTDPAGDAIIFEYEKNGEKATLRFPRNAAAGEIQDKINEFFPLPRETDLTDERERE